MFVYFAVGLGFSGAPAVHHRVLQTSPELDIKGTSCDLKPHSGHPQRVCGNVVPHHNWWSNLPKAPTWRSKETAKKQQRKSALRSARGKFAIHWTRFRITRFLFRGIANLSAAAFDLVGSICHCKCSTNGSKEHREDRHFSPAA